MSKMRGFIILPAANPAGVDESGDKNHKPEFGCRFARATGGRAEFTLLAGLLCYPRWPLSAGQG
jgi:hypothetical protein